MNKKEKTKKTNDKSMCKIYHQIILGYLIPTIIMTIICYPLLPSLLNYPPDSVNNAFQLRVVPTYYWVYYVLAVVLGILFELRISNS